MLKMIDTFSGIGGFSLAAGWTGGIETVQFVEREPFCQRILTKHWPTVPIHDDICTFTPPAGSADIITGGFPCQDISQAGKGAGLAGKRSGLFYELLRVIRLVGPRYVVMENVAAITSRGMDTVLGALAEAGYDAEWACIPAAAVGACHQRDRWWCVAYATGTGARNDEPRLRGQRDRKNLLGDGHTDAEVSERPAHASGAGWAGRRQQGPANADGCRVPEGGWSAKSTAYAQDMLSRGGTSKQQGKPGGQQVPKLRDGDWANAVYSDSERQQERQPASQSRQPQQPAWPDAPRRLSPDWRSYVFEPVLCRGNDGLSNRTHRLRALGNAVVPQVAMIPLLRVLELEAVNRLP